MLVSLRGLEKSYPQGAGRAYSPVRGEAVEGGGKNDLAQRSY